MIIFELQELFNHIIKLSYKIVAKISRPLNTDKSYITLPKQ